MTAQPESEIPAASTESSAQKRLAVSIVNWRTGKLAVDCLRSLAAEVEALPGCRVCVVDNDSQDGSDVLIEQAIEAEGWGHWACLLRATGNDGFATGNNHAIREILQSDPEIGYVLLLNPDTWVRPGALRLLAEFLDARSEVGIAGGRSEDPDATPQLCSFRFPSMIAEFASALSLGLFDRLVARHLTRLGIPEEPTQVDWLSGAVMMVRREVFETIGLMDEGYFLYYEETDFILRARRAGWTCWQVPASRVVHLVGQSSGVTEREGPARRLPAYWFESRRRYFVLNHGRAYAALTDALVVVGHCLRHVRRIVQRRPDDGPPRFLTDFIRHSALFRGRGSLPPRQTRL